MTEYNSPSGQAVGFLVWFRNQYQESTTDTYYQMADKYGQCNYGSCRNRVLELVKGGYMTICKPGGTRRRYCVNPQKYNELVNPYAHGSRTESTGKPED